MKKELHKIGKEPLPSTDEIPQHSNGEAKDMSHIEEYGDSLSDEEASHMHKHLSKRLSKDGESDSTNLPEPSIEDFHKAMKGDE